MHIVSAISAMLRAKPTTAPKLFMEFYPLPFSKYITIYNEQSIPSNHYDYFNNILFDIKGLLEQNDIKVVQILNAKSDDRIVGCYYIDAFSYSQLNYLVKNSLLHICSDAYGNEICGALSTPSICLAGNRYVENSFPWHGKSNPKNIMLGGPSLSRPTYSFTELPKSINKIPTEDLSRKILRMLGIDGFKEYETLFVGSKYHEKTSFDVVPNFEISEIPYSGDVFIRLDKLHNEENCMNFCSSHKFTLVTSKAISNELLSFAKANCQKVIFIVGKKTSTSDIDAFINNGIQVELVSNTKKIDKSLSFKLLEYGKIKPLKTEVKSSSRQSLHGKPFMSSKIIVSNKVSYPSYVHLEKGVPIGIINKTINSKTFWNDDSRYRIFKEKHND